MPEEPTDGVTPRVMNFGDDPYWAPEGERAFVVHHQTAAGCAPCHQVGDAGCGRRCLALIRVDEVLEALRAVESPGGSR